uniref:Uncharacterized protein n=1 Tax=Oryza punctata TaxID=4537 RepID=A0A0E0LTS6_ORYPU
MTQTIKLLLPTSDHYITPKDAYLGSDLPRAARIDWSKAVFDAIRDSVIVWRENVRLSARQSYITSCVPCILILYLDNLHLPQENGVDPLHTPRIQLYTKEMVEEISRLDRHGNGDGPGQFRQLTLRGVIGTCYNHPDYDKDEEPRGGNSGTPYAEELIRPVNISFPSMVDAIGVHLTRLAAEQSRRVLDAIGVFDRQAKVAAHEIAKQIRMVQTRQASVYNQIVNIINETQPPHWQSQQGDDEFHITPSLFLPSAEGMTDSQIDDKIEEIVAREGAPTLHQMNVVAQHDAHSNATPWSQPKRLIRKPTRFLSPIIIGEPHAPPPTNSALQLLATILGDQERYARAVLIESDRCIATGSDINLINIENITRNGSKEQFSLQALADHMRDVLRGINVSRTKLVVIPVLHFDHWSLYIFNSLHDRVDILDSNNYPMIGTKVEQHHSDVARKVMKCLSDGLQLCFPSKFPRFGRYRRAYIPCPKMAVGSNDCAFYVMKFMEMYDGDSAKLVHSFIPSESITLRAQLLYRLIFNRFNQAKKFHPDIEALRHNVE